MDNQLVWKEEFNIGIKIIDEEHQKGPWAMRLISQNSINGIAGGKHRLPSGLHIRVSVSQIQVYGVNG